MKKYIFTGLLLRSIVAQARQLNPKGVVPGADIVKHFSHPDFIRYDGSCMIYRSYGSTISAKLKLQGSIPLKTIYSWTVGAGENKNQIKIITHEIKEIDLITNMDIVFLNFVWIRPRKVVIWQLKPPQTAWRQLKTYDTPEKNKKIKDEKKTVN